MPKYRVYYVQTASVAVDVEAESAQEAEEMGFDKLPGGLCHQCAGQMDLSGDWDVDTDSEGETTTELIED
jgi:hypothetical protein